MFAVIISERIGETSKRARDEVVVHKPKSSFTPKTKGASTFTQKEISKYQASFNLQKDEVLRLKTTFDSVQKESNAKKEDSVEYGELFIFDRHLCLEFRIFGFVKQLVLPFAEVLSLLNSGEKPNEIEVQGKGYSYVLTLPETETGAWQIMEACRRDAGAEARRTTEKSTGHGFEEKSTFEQIDKQVSEAFNEAVRSATGDNVGRDTASGRMSRPRNNFSSMQLTNDDWGLFLSGAKQRRYKHGDFVLREGENSAALFQILQGTVRVELQLKDQETAVVVGHRGPGEMFGETSLLKEGHATASIVVDSENAILVCVDGSYLEKLFLSHPSLPGRFFAFLASYQAGRLRNLTASITSGIVEVAGHGDADIPIQEIFSNPAYLGIFNKFLTNSTPDDDDARKKHTQSLAAFDFCNDVKEKYKTEPNHELMKKEATRLVSTFIDPTAPRVLDFLTADARTSIQDAVASLASATSAAGGADEMQLRAARAIFDAAQVAAIETINSNSYADFLASEHLLYILELKAKEGTVPGLPDFRLLRVLGEGGFGQVLEVVKRDSGKHYAMKMMKKDLMRKCFASSWRSKIWLEKDLMSSLNHPFMVNLAYAFQNPVFLVLVMDLVPGGDLSDYVLTKKRLTVEQVRTVMMETVVVINYCHQEMVLYRDLKPENLLIDEFGHIRLIDMGLATRMTKSQPRRMSRVGTECYMAPEVRWAKDRREPYGVSADWYTVGVLLYEFSAGDLPYENPDAKVPTYSEFKFPDPRAEDLVKLLLKQDHTQRLGCGPEGVGEIRKHPYWNGVEWDLVPLKKFESPCTGLKEGKSSKKKRQEKENAAIEVAAEYAAADAEDDQSAPVSNWDFVAPTAIIEEYMENMYHCVSAI
uniref:cGMP-dependent protein kinase n=1 Tax=Haptolina brevifila TaxID=156173 RepID=A0A7S2C4X5_9EUKA